MNVGETADTTKTWQAFVGTSLYCEIAAYTVACDGPYLDNAYNTPGNFYGTAGPLTSDICSDIFDFDTDINVRSITTKIIANGFSAKYAGYYKITITGTVERYASKTVTAELRWRLKNNCSSK